MAKKYHISNDKPNKHSSTTKTNATEESKLCKAIMNLRPEKSFKEFIEELEKKAKKEKTS